MSALTLVLALTLTAPPPPPPADAAPPAPDAAYAAALSTARKHVAGERPSAAAEAYGQALEARPQDAVAMSGRGYARLLAGRYDEAASDLRKAQKRAQTARERKMIDHNLGLAEAGRRCGVYVDRTRVPGRVGATPGAAVGGSEDAAPRCDGACDGVVPLVLGDETKPLDAFVVMPRADGTWAASPVLASGLAGRCGVFPEVRVLSRDPLVVRVEEEYQDMDWDEDLGTSCWISSRDVRDVVLDPATLDVLLVVGRHRGPKGEDGTSELTDGAFHVTACGATRTVPVGAPTRR